jgi:hypothetical protein
MDEISSKSSNMVFDHFKKGNYDAVLDILDKIKDSMSKHEGEENEGSYVLIFYLPQETIKLKKFFVICNYL